MTLSKVELIQSLKYVLSNQNNDNILLEYRSDKYGLYVKTAETKTEQPRNLKFHEIRSRYLIQFNSHDFRETSDFKVWLRDYKITELNSEVDAFTRKERQEIELLRIKTELEKNKLKVITRQDALNSYFDSIKIGDRVSYNNMPGIITYRHMDSNPAKFTINIKDTFHRYVPGDKIFPRNVEDLSHIDVPDEVKKLTTKELLARLDECRQWTISRTKPTHSTEVYKAELQTREHIKKIKKTIDYGEHRRI